MCRHGPVGDSIRFALVNIARPADVQFGLQTRQAPFSALLARFACHRPIAARKAALQRAP
jgi:hypothetical protein